MSNIQSFCKKCLECLNRPIFAWHSLRLAWQMKLGCRMKVWLYSLCFLSCLLIYNRWIRLYPAFYIYKVNLCIFLLVFSIVITSLLFHFSIRFFHYYFWLLLLFYKHYLSKTITERAQWIALPVLLGLLQQWSSSEKGPETVFWVLLIICTCTSFCAYLRESVSVSVWAPTLAHVFPYEYFKRKYLCVIMT